MSMVGKAKSSSQQCQTQSGARHLAGGPRLLGTSVTKGRAEEEESDLTLKS